MLPLGRTCTSHHSYASRTCHIGCCCTHRCKNVPIIICIKPYSRTDVRLGQLLLLRCSHVQWDCFLCTQLMINNFMDEKTCVEARETTLTPYMYNSVARVTSKQDDKQEPTHMLGLCTCRACICLLHTPRAPSIFAIPMVNEKVSHICPLFRPHSLPLDESTHSDCLFAHFSYFLYPFLLKGH